MGISLNSSIKLNSQIEEVIMKILKYKLPVFLILAAFVIFLAGCSPETVEEPDDPEVQLSGEIVDGMREVSVEMSASGFNPDEIRVQEGEEIRLIFTTTDEAHEFVMDEFDINVPVEPGETAEVTFTADTIGGEYRSRFY
jgi:heme/copper-type cytochrome/quinol oxidase subunit 2